MSGEFPPLPGESAVGAQIAGYQLVEQIGRGGMAVVYRALDVRLDRWVALKIMAPEAARDEAFRLRFIHESRAAAAVDHPHIIPIFEAGQASGMLFIAMRYVAGGDVRALVSRLGLLTASRASSIITQMASALDAAHSSGLVHRDVKPGNMLIGVVAAGGYPDHVYLSDFGLSKQSVSSASLTAVGQFLGTLDYIAPEQIEGRPVDGRADLYGLACTAFEILSGAPPFRRDQDMALMWAQLSEPPPPLTSRRPDLPPAVDHVLARALAKSPDDRYESCLDFAAALRAACGPDRDIAGRLPTAPTAPPRPATEQAGAVQIPAAVTAHGHPGRPGLADRRRRGSADRRQPDSADRGRPDRGRPMPPGPPERRGGRPRRRSRARLVVAVVAVIAVAGGAYALLRDGGPGSRPAAASSAPSGRASSAGPVAQPGPAATVKAYFAAISRRDYVRAWRLGGRNATSSYPDFVQGFSTTATDRPTILSVSGTIVTARITALQSDGSEKIYQGNYTVEDGVITNFDVRQIS